MGVAVAWLYTSLLSAIFVVNLILQRHSNFNFG